MNKTFYKRLPAWWLSLLWIPLLSCGGGGGDGSGGTSATSNPPGPATSAQWTGTKEFGTAADDHARGIVIDSKGSLYVAGYTNGGLDGNPNAGGYDTILVKYSSAGTKEWTRQLGTFDADHALAVALTTEGDIYVTGATYGNFDENAQHMNISSFPRFFLAKFNSNGDKQWVRQIGESGRTIGTGVVADRNGNAYAAGYTDLQLEGNINAGLNDIFLVKYASDGTKQWTRQLGSILNDGANAVAIDTDNNIYMTGSTLGNLDGNISAGGSDIFLVKYSPEGDRLWTRQIGTPDEDFGNAVAVDAAGNAYVTGSTNGSVDGNANIGGTDIILIKYNSSGVRQWTRQIGTTLDDNGLALAIDRSGYVYITGSTKGSLDGNTNAGGKDYFVIKYNSEGMKQWSKQVGSASDDVGYGVTTDGEGNAYVTGDTGGNLDGNINLGQNDIFIAK